VKPTYLLLYSGGLACTVTMLNSIREGLKPLLLFYKNLGPAGEGEREAVIAFSSRYDLPVQTIPYAARSHLHITDREALMMVELAREVANERGLKSVVIGRRTFMGSAIPTAMNLPATALYLPRVEHRDEDYRAALNYEPTLFRATFSCTESFNEVPCGKCEKCKSTAALYKRIRKG